MCLHVFGKALVYLLDTVVLVKRKKIIEHYYVPITFAYNHIGTICGGELDPMQKPKFREISHSQPKNFCWCSCARRLGTSWLRGPKEILGDML